MKIYNISLMSGIFCCLPALSLAADDNLEERIKILEERIQKAEARATKAEMESKLTNNRHLSTLPKISPSSLTETEVNILQAEDIKTTNLTLNNLTDLKLYGDVEFNFDGASRSGQLTSLKSSDDKYWKAGDTERWNINGRILIGLDGYRSDQNGNFAGFSVQPLADMTGKMNLDDAAFRFGSEQDWQVKIGRFEAYDMFPLNQDTFIQYSGNTANDLYADGFGYIYMMKEGRGRSNSGGSLMLSKYAGDWYFELNTLVENGTSKFQEDRYHGNVLDNNKNVAYLRPVIAWQKERFRAAFGMESNVVNNAYGFTNKEGKWIDQSKRNGYGLSLNWNNTSDNPNGVDINFNTAYLDATDEKDFTGGINFLWRNFELGYIYAKNNIKAFNTDALELNVDNPLREPGNYHIQTVHTSYLIPDVLNFKNFNLYLGAYYSHLQTKSDNRVANSDVDDRYGIRARFKYFF